MMALFLGQAREIKIRWLQKRAWLERELESVKGKRGTASRRIVRERMQELEGQGVLVSARGSRGRTFRVSEDIVEKWSQVLGFPKYKDQPVQGQGNTR